MIVRTAPILLPDADAMRAMVRLESQLRRAADDLAETLDAMRAAMEAPLIKLPMSERMGTRARCGEWMPRPRQSCGRTPGHGGGHRSLSVVIDEAVRRRAERAA